MKFTNIYGSTPIDADGLLPGHIQTQEELNEWEQANILQALTWLNNQKLKLDKFAKIEFCKKLHKKMFAKTWRWAGKFRTSNRNIGVNWPEINMALKNLFDDVLFQINNDVEHIDLIAIKFHHRLVFIHPFPNGNGRHARLATDCLLSMLGCREFTWGKENLTSPGQTRNEYINALKLADKSDYSLLYEFARS